MRCLRTVPSVLCCCWLGGRKGIWPVKNWVVGCWHGYLSGARCRFAYGPAGTTAILCLLLQEIQIGFGFTFLVLAHPGSPDKIQRAVKCSNSYALYACVIKQWQIEHTSANCKAVNTTLKPNYEHIWHFYIRQVNGVKLAEIKWYLIFHPSVHLWAVYK